MPSIPVARIVHYQTPSCTMELGVGCANSTPYRCKTPATRSIYEIRRPASKKTMKTMALFAHSVDVVSALGACTMSRLATFFSSTRAQRVCSITSEQPSSLVYSTLPPISQVVLLRFGISTRKYDTSSTKELGSPLKPSEGKGKEIRVSTSMKGEMKGNRGRFIGYQAPPTRHHNPRWARTKEALPCAPGAHTNRCQCHQCHDMRLSR